MTYSAETRVFAVDPQRPDPVLIHQAARVIQAGGLVAFPTETVYGLGANALDAHAVSRIFAAKGRPASDPVIVHIGQKAQMGNIAREIPPLAERLADAFWPGPLTLVLERRNSVPANVAAGGPSVGIRMPKHPVALALLRACGLPIAAPSANLFARPSPTTAQHVLDDLDGRVDIVLDGGPTSVGVESTVLDLTQHPPRVLRPGGISLELLRQHIPDVTYVSRFLDADETAAGPGMLLKHYSPRAEVRLFDGPADRAIAAIRQEANALHMAGKRVGILTVEEEGGQFSDVPGEVLVLGSLGDLESVARNLFAAFRALDTRGVDVILVRALPDEGLGLAIRDRLIRAAEGRVIKL